MIFFHFYTMTKQNMTPPPPRLYSYFYVFFGLFSIKFLISTIQLILHLQDALMCRVILGHGERCAILDGHAVMQGAWGKEEEASHP